jgi:hypothetical protein
MGTTWNNTWEYNHGNIMEYQNGIIMFLEWPWGFPKLKYPQVTIGFNTKSWSDDLDDFLGGSPISGHLHLLPWPF